MEWHWQRRPVNQKELKIAVVAEGCWWCCLQDPVGCMAVHYHSEYLPQPHYITKQQLCNMLPRPRLHHDNNCPDDGWHQVHNDNGCRKVHYNSGCCDDSQRRIYPDNNSYDDGRPVLQGIAGGRLFRSRSEETLSSMSLLPRRRLSTIRRRKKVAVATTDRLISDFNDGKEVDLDKLTEQVTMATDGFDDGGEQVGKLEEHDHISTQANVVNWLRTQNDASKWIGSAAKYHSLAVHHLWTLL